jgi:hypothetical protein
LVYLLDPDRAGQFAFRTGDFTAQAASDPAEGVIAKADDTPISTGALFRLYQGAVSVKWFGAKGDGVTDDRAACQAAINFVAAQAGGKVLFPDGTYKLIGAASPDSLKNGINIPFFGSFEPGRPIILEGEGKATLVAGSDNMIVIRCSTPESYFRNLRINGGNAMWTGFANTWGIAYASQNREVEGPQISVSSAHVVDCVVEMCEEGLYYETGSSGAPASGAYYNNFERNTFNFNTRHMYFGPGAFSPDNWPTRSYIAGNRFTRGGVGIDLEYASEFTMVANNFEMFEGPDRPIGPRGERTAIYIGERSINNYLIGGYAEDCDNALFYHPNARPSALITRDFVSHNLAVNKNAGFAGMLSGARLRLVREVAANQALRIEFAHDAFASIVADSAMTGTRDLVVRTFGKDRQRWPSVGGASFFGTDGQIDILSNGRTIRSTGAGGLSLAADGDYIQLNALGSATSIRVHSDSLQPVAGAMNLGKDGTLSTGRWNRIYLQNNPDVASDGRLKIKLEWSEAELRVSAVCAGLITPYRMREAALAPGEAALRRIGVIAQEVVAAFAAEGLDALDYELVNHAVWDDEYAPVTEIHELPIKAENGEWVEAPGNDVEIETGEMRLIRAAGDMYSVAYEELLAFIAKGQEIRLQSLETRLVAIGG